MHGEMEIAIRKVDLSTDWQFVAPDLASVCNQWTIARGVEI
jgi:hypothetical protein